MNFRDKIIDLLYSDGYGKNHVTIDHVVKGLKILYPQINNNTKVVITKLPRIEVANFDYDCIDITIYDLNKCYDFKSHEMKIDLDKVIFNVYVESVYVDVFGILYIRAFNIMERFKE